MAGRTPIPTESPKKRIKDFSEVVSGYDLQRAIAEASRCLYCHDAPCQKGCPAGIDIAEFIDRVKTGDMWGAIEVIRDENVLPGICGRVCPVEELCEKNCCSEKLNEPIAIGALQRFAADYEKGKEIKPKRLEPTGKKVAIIGSGPASLAAASELLKMGYKVTVFESRALPGGLLSYGISPYKLPKDVADWEIEYIKNMGTEIVANRPIRRIGELFEQGFNAVFIGVGTTKSVTLNIPGENLKGVHLGLEFVESIITAIAGGAELPSLSGKRVAVIGGGDVAIVAARCSLRLGAEKAFIVYRRSFEEMPAHVPEIEAAMEENIEFLILATPTKIIGRERVEGLECVKMKLGPPDESGRRRPVPIPGSEFKLDVDVVIEAIGQKVDEEFIRENSDVKISKGSIIIDKETGMTSKSGIFAGGDAIGGGTVVQAIAEGKVAARGIDEYLKRGSK